MSGDAFSPSGEFTKALAELADGRFVRGEKAGFEDALQALIDDEIKRHRAPLMGRLAIQFRALNRGAVSLSMLIEALARDGHLEGKCHKGVTVADLRSVEFREGYMFLLGEAKRAIKSGSLIVRQLSTMCPANDCAGVRLWCDSDDTLKSVQEMEPHPRLVVKATDAEGWLIGMGVDVPSWLKDIANPAQLGGCVECGEAAEISCPDKWSRGLKRIAWDVACGLLEGGRKITGKALLDGITKHDAVRFDHDLVIYKSVNASLKGGEVSASNKTVMGDWRKQLEQLLASSSPG